MWNSANSSVSYVSTGYAPVSLTARTTVSAFVLNNAVSDVLKHK